jgi:hypothetical protein
MHNAIKKTIEMHGMCSTDYFVPIYQVNTHGDLAGGDLDRIWRWRTVSCRLPSCAGGMARGDLDCIYRWRTASCAGLASHRRPAGSGGALLAGAVDDAYILDVEPAKRTQRTKTPVRKEAERKATSIASEDGGRHRAGFTSHR